MPLLDLGALGEPSADGAERRRGSEVEWIPEKPHEIAGNATDRQSRAAASSIADR